MEADLDPASGAILKAVLDAIVDRMHQDGRFNDLAPAENTCGRRTAEGFMEMVHRSSGVNPDQPAVHPDIVVVVPLAALAAGEPDPFDPPTLIGGGPLTMAEVTRLALLGTVSTMTVDENGRPLNLGRKQRLATADQWILVVEQMVMVGWMLDPVADGTWRLTRPDSIAVDAPRYPGEQRPPPRAGPRPRKHDDRDESGTHGSADYRSEGRSRGSSSPSSARGDTHLTKPHTSSRRRQPAGR